MGGGVVLDNGGIDQLLHLTAPADQETVCRDLNGIQAQFLSAALHALAIRTAGPVEPDKLVKSW